MTDLMMPVMGGGELVERLRADPATAEIPILVLSSNANTVLTLADLSMGKPFVPQSLVDAARSLAGTNAA